MTQDTQTPTRSARVFTGSETLGTNMNQLLVDLTDLHIQGKQAHWNVVGKNFRDLHLQLDELVDAAREFSDDVAERMRALYLVPDARAVTIANTSTLPPFPAEEVSTTETVDLITSSVYAVTSTGRRIHDATDAEDPTTADLIHGILERLEQLAWMIDAENRVPGEGVRSIHA
ncbi:Dps family protein [Nocardioides bruguierae]|uniref:DNA starvation/stationary phase protection protein n=1 Tax=Nocardioides bruguierae TaxID=2945102 RepID=A0A9X2IHK0_9ACTN|nr:DNA starvation/stationary phase protection protein [Nocardioides bruguierae]MCL8024697.1 DNA starvation/stationary phase protection protein [Nocardioides bruguierae]MCM0621880.1 DNA starvation/stationary phase protection protein [Nocardioides bruguierae]